MLDTGNIAPGAAAALARLEEIQDPHFEALRTANEAYASLTCTKQWAHLRDTFDLQDWMPLLIAVGADHGNIVGLSQLAQQGVSGRVEANRLLWTWCHPQSSSKAQYKSKAQVFQAAIRNARKFLDCPPLASQDFKNWVPGHSLGPYWEPKLESIPSWAEAAAWVGKPKPPAPGMMPLEDHKSLVDKAVAEAKAGMLTMEEVQEEKEKAVREAMESLDLPRVLRH